MSESRIRVVDVVGQTLSYVVDFEKNHLEDTLGKLPLIVDLIEATALMIFQSQE